MNQSSIDNDTIQSAQQNLAATQSVGQVPLVNEGNKSSHSVHSQNQSDKVLNELGISGNNDLFVLQQQLGMSPQLPSDGLAQTILQNQSRFNDLQSIGQQNLANLNNDTAVQMIMGHSLGKSKSSNSLLDINNQNVAKAPTQIRPVSPIFPHKIKNIRLSQDSEEGKQQSSTSSKMKGKSEAKLNQSIGRKSSLFENNTSQNIAFSFQNTIPIGGAKTDFKVNPFPSQKQSVPQSLFDSKGGNRQPGNLFQQNQSLFSNPSTSNVQKQPAQSSSGPTANQMNLAQQSFNFGQPNQPLASGIQSSQATAPISQLNQASAPVNQPSSLFGQPNQTLSQTSKSNQLVASVGQPAQQTVAQQSNSNAIKSSNFSGLNQPTKLNVPLLQLDKLSFNMSNSMEIHQNQPRLEPQSLKKQPSIKQTTNESQKQSDDNPIKYIPPPQQILDQEHNKQGFNSNDSNGHTSEFEFESDLDVNKIDPQQVQNQFNSSYLAQLQSSQSPAANLINISNHNVTQHLDHDEQSSQNPLWSNNFNYPVGSKENSFLQQITQTQGVAQRERKSGRQPSNQTPQAEMNHGSFGMQQLGQGQIQEGSTPIHFRKHSQQEERDKSGNPDKRFQHQISDNTTSQDGRKIAKILKKTQQHLLRSSASKASEESEDTQDEPPSEDKADSSAGQQQNIRQQIKSQSRTRGTNKDDTAAISQSDIDPQDAKSSKYVWIWIVLSVGLGSLFCIVFVWFVLLPMRSKRASSRV